MEIKFKNTYVVSVLNPGDCDIEFQLSDYDTFEEFAKELKAHKIKCEQGSLACCSPWDRKQSDTTERLN